MRKMFNIESVIFAKAYLINKKYREIYFSTVKLHIVNSLVVRTIKTQHPRYRTPITHTWCGCIKYYKTRDVYVCVILPCSISYRHLQQALRALSLQKIMTGNAEIYARMHPCLHSCFFQIFNPILFWCKILRDLLYKKILRSQKSSIY